MMTGRRRQRLGALGSLAIAVLAAVVAVVLLLRGGGDGPDAALDEFLAAFAARDYDRAAALTDGPRDRVARALAANVEGLDGARLTARAEEVEEDEGAARARVAMSWRIPAIGELSYANDAIRLHERDDRWVVRWRETVVHPALDARGMRLGTVKDVPPRAPILDRDGRPLVRDRPVVEIGVVPQRLRNRDKAITAIAEHTHADRETLARSVERAGPWNFVPAITLRKRQAERVRPALERIPGIEFGERELPLAPTKEFGRAVLGAVGPVTAEQLEDDPGSGHGPGDLVGQGGLQARFEERLAGRPARRVVVRLVDGSVAKTLHRVEGERGRPLRTTLDLAVQHAAEAALGTSDGNAALVAVEASSGDVLAAANRPGATGFNRGFEGSYPPGSTFKVVTTAALLDRGLSPDTRVECPRLLNVGGKLFRNFEDSAAGSVPFREDFADSCNTAFVSLVDRLDPADLGRWGRRFGLEREYELALPAYSGSVPAGRDTVEQAASMIGQGRILASPLAMAGVAASVLDGRWRAPRLLASDPAGAGPPLPEPIAGTLTELMRAVVTSGTGTALAGVPGEPIGKSGTAEYGGGDPSPPTHAWFVAGRGDLALAVLLEDKPAGGSHAAPVAARFFSALDAR